MAEVSTEAKQIPPVLLPGSTIALISPSARLNDLLPFCIDRASDYLKSLGFKVEVIYSALPSNCTIKESALHRVAEIHQAFLEPQITAIVCTIGGSTCNELLPYLDYDMIKRHPKIFCGFSDITLLHYSLYLHADLRTFYGPTAITQWTEHPTTLPFTTNNFLKALTSTQPLNQLSSSETRPDGPLNFLEPESLSRPRRMKPNNGWRWLRPGKATGIIFGGCLPVILRIIGTKYDLPSYKGVILLLELPEGEERKAYPVARANSQIRDLFNRGVFDDVAGLVLGRPYGYSDAMTRNWEKYVVECVGEREIPVLGGVDVGHIDPLLTIPLGAQTEMDSEEGRWAVVEAGVR